MLRIAVWALLLILVVGISLTNRNMVALKLPFLPYEAGMPLYILVVLCIAIGFGLAWLQHIPRAYRRFVEHRRTSAKLQAVTTELAAIRMEQQPTLPVHDSSTSASA